MKVKMVTSYSAKDFERKVNEAVEEIEKRTDWSMGYVNYSCVTVDKQVMYTAMLTYVILDD